MYKIETIKTIRSMSKRAEAVEKKANEMAAAGYELVSMCSTPNFGVILAFKKD